MKIVGVMGSHAERWDQYARPLGVLIARLGCHLLTGGGAGTMEAVSEAFCATSGRKGLCIGVLPNGPPPGYPNRFVEIAIRTSLPRFDEHNPTQITRNSINVLTSDAIVALPGRKGTANEIELAIRYSKPLILFGGSQELQNVAAQDTQSIDEVERFLKEALGV